MTKKLEIREVNQFSPLTLAFLGDAVYEQLVRERLVIEANMSAGKLHDMKIKLVCSSYQSNAIEMLKEHLTEDEYAIYKRGRNASGNTVPKNANACEYRRATGLECLFGYLHLLGEKQRIDELFDLIWNFNGVKES
jgi:ribonuclease-3 family protein